MDLSETSSTMLQRHPWEIARFDFFSRLILRKQLHLRPLRVLDVGSGDAWFASGLLQILADGSSISCYDPVYSDSQLRTMVSDPHITLLNAWPDGKFDLVLLLDVLEHAENDVGFLKQIVTEVVPTGGVVVISLPAWVKLFGPHDIRLHHYRRYQPSDGIRLLQNSGLELELYGGLFHLLLLPRLLQVLFFRVRLLKQPSARAGDWSGGYCLTNAVAMILKTETKISLLLARIGIRFPGLSWWAICRKH